MINNSNRLRRQGTSNQQSSNAPATPTTIHKRTLSTSASPIPIQSYGSGHFHMDKSDTQEQGQHLNNMPPLILTSLQQQHHTSSVFDRHFGWNALKCFVVIFIVVQVFIVVIHNNGIAKEVPSGLFDLQNENPMLVHVPLKNSLHVTMRRLSEARSSSSPTSNTKTGLRKQGKNNKSKSNIFELEAKLKNDELTLKNKKFSLDLHPDQELFHKDFVHIKITNDNGEFKATKIDTNIDCIFKGNDIETNQEAIISTCDGQLNGVIHSKDDDPYYISTHDTGSILYRSRDLKEHNAHLDDHSCGAEVSYHSTKHETNNHQKNSNGRVLNADGDTVSRFNSKVNTKKIEFAEEQPVDSSSQIYPDKFVKLVLVSDAKRFTGVFNSDSARNLASIKNIGAQIKAIYNNFPAFLAGFNIRVQIVGIISVEASIDPWDVTQSPFSPNQVNAATLLSSFNTWRASALASKAIPPHTAAHLLSGYDFEGSTVGTASMSSACDSSSSSGVNQANTLADSYVAKIISHELGHNLGLRHTSVFISGSAVASSLDAQKCMASDSVNVMAAAMQAGLAAFSWESCSALWFKMFLKGFPYDCTPGTCTYDKSYGSSSNSLCMETQATEVDDDLIKCGDGIVEGDEECDCGILSAAECARLDPCCDRSTCRLRSGAKCSAKDPCCDSATCSYVPALAKKVCRNAVSECDLAETCNGVSSDCPTNQFKDPGVSCVLSQPSIVLTPTRKTGLCYKGECLSHDKQCNDILATGVYKTISGECPRAGDDSGDLSCGKLYCKQILTEYCSTSFYVPTLAMVKEGTPCGAGKQCYGGKCVELGGIVDNDTSGGNNSGSGNNTGGSQSGTGNGNEAPVKKYYTTGGYAAEKSLCAAEYALPNGRVVNGCTAFTDKEKPSNRKRTKPTPPDPTLKIDPAKLGWCYTGTDKAYTVGSFDWGYCQLG